MTWDQEIAQQRAADDVAVIAEAIEECQSLIAKFHREHGEKLSERLFASATIINQIDQGEGLADIWNLSNALVPPDHGGES